MEFTPRAAELTNLLENRIINYYTDLKVDEIGRVVSVGDGIARVYGLNKIQAGEMVEFASGVKGIALNFVGGAFFIYFQMLCLAAYIVYVVLFIKECIIISSMKKTTIPDLNTTIPGSSDPASSSENDPEKQKKIRRCRNLIKKWIQDYCLKICVGKGACRPKCISQMSDTDQEKLIDSIWRGFQFDENPSSRRIDYVWRKARDLAPSEVEKHPITRAWKGQWSWDDL
jgi:hypothetical protein